MLCVCNYDPIKDIAPVEPFGAVDLAKMNFESSVPSVVPISEARFNGIEDPNSIAGRPSDTFEAMQANKVISGYKAPSSGAGNGDGNGSDGAE